jgi:glycerol uptake facilitator-like aquaporin
MAVMATQSSRCVAEVIGTFPQLCTIIAPPFDRWARAEWAGLIIRLAVTADILPIGPVTGVSMNRPAREVSAAASRAVQGEIRGRQTREDRPAEWR